MLSPIERQGCGLALLTGRPGRHRRVALCQVALGFPRLNPPSWCLEKPSLETCLQESTAGQRQQQRHQGPDWFQEQATGSGAETPWEAAYTSLQTAAAILQWVVDEAEVRRAAGLAAVGHRGGCAAKSRYVKASLLGCVVCGRRAGGLTTAPRPTLPCRP